MFKYSLIVFLALIHTFSMASTKIVYGLDDRKEFYESSEQFKKWSRASAAMFGRFQLKDKVDHYEIFSSTLEEHGVCSSERFANQVAGAGCSGFLVSKNLLVTAGHCITEQSDCENYLWAFDYQLNYPGEKVTTIDKKNTYGCRKIVERYFNFFTKNDYALIELDRNVEGRTPLKYRTRGKVQKDEPLVLMGYPNGVPLKIAAGAVVRKRKWKHFRANLDAFTMNSGSAVINTNTGVVEGILVGGGEDFNEINGCKVVNQVDYDKGRGEDVSYITNIEYLRNLLSEVP